MVLSWGFLETIAWSIANRMEGCIGKCDPRAGLRGPEKWGREDGKVKARWCVTCLATAPSSELSSRQTLTNSPWAWSSVRAVRESLLSTPLSPMTKFTPRSVLLSFLAWVKEPFWAAFGKQISSPVVWCVICAVQYLQELETWWVVAGQIWASPGI